MNEVDTHINRIHICRDSDIMKITTRRTLLSLLLPEVQSSVGEQLQILVRVLSFHEGAHYVEFVTFEGLLRLRMS